MKTIGILGEGAWGTALANLCADNGFTVYLWCHDKKVKEAIEVKRQNPKYLPSITVHSSVIPTIKLEDIFTHTEWVIETTPVKYLRSVLEQCVSYVSPQHIWVIASKGIENDTLFFPTQIIDNVFSFTPKKMVVVGPSFAKEVVEKAITAVSIAASNPQEGVMLQKMLANSYFRPYVHTDLIGAQIGGAVKNIIALGVGMLHGAGYSDNTKAFLLTRGIYETMQLAVTLGAQPQTVYGLSGVGDMVLTGMSSQSRNREIGMFIGKGKVLDDILHKTGYIPEGVNSARSIYQLMQKKELDLPVCKGIYEVLFEGKTIKQIIEAIMARPLEFEYDF